MVKTLRVLLWQKVGWPVYNAWYEYGIKDIVILFTLRVLLPFIVALLLVFAVLYSYAALR